jgi:hypothetical protein
MDTTTGRVSIFAKLIADGVPEKNLVPVDLDKLPAGVRRLLEKDGVAWIAPRSRCPCGSGRRFKSCCMGRTREEIERELKRRGKLA